MGDKVANALDNIFCIWLGPKSIYYRKFKNLRKDFINCCTQNTSKINSEQWLTFGLHYNNRTFLLGSQLLGINTGR